jgi:hypothetical protein
MFGSYAFSQAPFSSDVSTGGGGNVYADSLTESITFTDSQSAVQIQVSSVAESLTATDSTTSVLTAVAFATESGTAADSQATQLIAIAFAVESGSAQDSQIGYLVVQVNLSEAGSTADALSAALVRIGELSETLSASDGYVGTGPQNIYATLSEALTVADSVSNYGNVFVTSLSEAGSASDAPRPSQNWLGDIAEAAAADGFFVASLLWNPEADNSSSWTIISDNDEIWTPVSGSSADWTPN